MKQNSDPGTSYCAELFKYNQVHRLIGNVSCETLVNESSLAIKASIKDLENYTTMVDIGAGAGILGYAWLKSNLKRQVIFLEPDQKACAFLHGYFATEPRAKVIQKRLTQLTMEEVSSFEPDSTKVFMAARAFSSRLGIEESYRNTELTHPLFNFQKTDAGFSLKKLL
jgi:16S rRNA G527 N7-methylase RsmG